MLMRLGINLLLCMNRRLEDEMEESKIIVFYGADDKVGVTMVCQSIGSYVANAVKTEKVLLLHLDGKPGMDYTEDSAYGLDEIKVRLESDVLTRQELIDACKKDGNLYNLKGTTNLLERKTYQPDIVEKLLRLVEGYFDLILVDSGSNIDMGLSIGSLEATDHLVLVTTQQQSSLNSYKCKKQVFDELDIAFTHCIVNKYVEKGFLQSESQIGSKLGLKTMVLPLSTYGWQAEIDRRCLLDYKDADYVQSIENMVKVFSSEGILNAITFQEKKSFWKKR